MATLFPWLGVCAAAFLLSHCDTGTPYMTTRGGKKELRQTLQLREEQNGIAGTNVYLWTVEPSGAWNYTEYLLRRGKEAPGTRTEKKGALSQEQLQGLAQVLMAQDLDGLPNKLGPKTSGVNRHTYTLQFGKAKSVTLEGASPRRGSNLRENILDASPGTRASEAPARARFANIAQAIQERLQEGKE